ncbi:MAG: glycosyltransferase family 39 protein [Opitutaceae bacterium]|nr:glycosyltransferase family 39 protein [Opitutaceae bacterium]
MTTADALTGILGAITLVLPGWLAARAGRVPLPLLAGFVAGVVGLVSVVIAIDAAGVPLSPLSLGAAWAALTMAAALAAWNARSRPEPAGAPSAWRPHALLLLPLVPVLAVVVYRAAAQPLFGVDTVFRWNYLAEQMLARGTLSFYPPVTAADYEIYSWPDGIAPAVASVYAWIYGLAGATRPALTAPVVVLQFALVLAAIHALARRLFSDRAAAGAVALAACSPLLAWSTAMGQETGLTAIALLALLLYLPGSRAEETTGRLGFAGLAAGLGGLAREYGLVLPLLGLALCAGRRLSPGAALRFAFVALVTTAPWYLRNALHTGNPLFNLSLGGLFPVNEVHAWLNASYQAELGWGRLPAEAPRLLLVHTVAALAGLVAGGVLGGRRAPALLLAAAVFIALWAASVGYTAAGFMYSLRVLSPALAVAAVLGGAALANWIPERRWLGVAVAGLTLFSTDAALRTLTLPANVYRIPPADWLTVGRALHAYHERPIYRELARVTGSERLLVLGPNALLSRHGARPVPLWSPDARFVFDASLSPPEIARRLRAGGIGFVLLTQGAVNARFLARSAFFRDPAGTLQPVWSDADLVLLRVHAPPP